MSTEQTLIKGAEQQRPFIVGLTGGIACGKSTVSRYLAETYAIPIIDTDVIARDLVKVGSSTLDEILAHFGESIVDKQGQLDRRQLRNIISSNTTERQWLNALMHPRIYEAVMSQIDLLESVQAPYVMIIIPLLSTNSPYLILLNEVCVIDCDEALQKQRLITRDQMGEDIAQQLINAQPSRSERLALATSVIVNNGTSDNLIEQTDALHHQLMTVTHNQQV